MLFVEDTTPKQARVQDNEALKVSVGEAAAVISALLSKSLTLAEPNVTPSHHGKHNQKGICVALICPYGHQRKLLRGILKRLVSTELPAFQCLNEVKVWNLQAVPKKKQI